MKAIGGLMIGLFLGLCLLSCFDPPEYPEEPQINYKSLRFIDAADASFQDSLILEVTFKDGDGNLGLDPEENGCFKDGNRQICFNDKTYWGIGGRPINYEMRRLDPVHFDTLPEFKPPFSCTNWEVSSISGKLDTLYFTLNENYANIFVDFLVKNNDGTFTEFDWDKVFVYPKCEVQGFNGRFPILFKTPYQKGPLEGVIRYAMPSIGFTVLFSVKTLKLRIRIQDRLLNKSNVIETPEFTLQSIKG